MDIKEFERIMSDDDIGGSKISDFGCNAAKGLDIIRKYIPNRGISGADHDVIYSVTMVDLVNAGISKNDAIFLRELNWMIEDDRLACFV